MRSLYQWPIFSDHLEPSVARSLSIQFILQELLLSSEVLDHLKRFTLETLRGVNRKEEVRLISKELELFFLFSLENAFVQKGSVLDKLCFYCDILIKASRICESELTAILEEMRKSMFQIKAKIIPWEKSPVPYDEIVKDLMNLFTSLRHNLARLFTVFCPYLKEARSDENVLVCLIEHKERFNALLGARRIEDLLKSFFPAGHDQLYATIYEGYSRRGFTKFLSKVEPLIQSIEWETKCHPAQTH